MYFRIGNEITLGGNSAYKLESPISGLSTPEIRTGDGNYAGVDGGYVSSQLYEMRTIVLTGFFLGTCSEVETLRRNLLTKLHIRKLYPIFITNFSGLHYFTEGYVTDIKADITGKRAGEYQVTLLCPDPIIYDGGDGLTSDSAWVEGMIFKQRDGGFVIPEDMPVQWTSGNNTVIIENTGTVNTYPIITLRGQFSYPVIENVTTGKYIVLDYESSEGDEIIIDMKERIITLNGVSIAAYRTTDSTWWDLEVGRNEILFATDEDYDTDWAMLKYRQGYEGI